MSAIRPNPEQFKQLAQSPEKGAVVMLNLLKFKLAAEGETGSGQDAYQREMVSNPDYLKAHAHREAGLERTIVIACTPAVVAIKTGAGE